MAFPRHDAFNLEMQVLSGRSKALAHPARLLILSMLNVQPMHVRDIVKHLPLTQPTISSHLEILMRVGFICVEVEGRYNKYRIQAVAIGKYREELMDFMDRFNEGDSG